VLSSSSISLRVFNGIEAVVVAIPQPKARWWLDAVDVPCFGSKPNVMGPDVNPFCPAKLWKAYCAGSPARKGKHNVKVLPAFHFADGSALSRNWMVRRTIVLCGRAGIALSDHKGVKMPIKSASWRAGGVRSARDAGLSDTMIMFLGRWTSNAWRAYMLHTPIDVQGAAHQMWSVQSPPPGGQRSGTDSGAEATSLARDKQATREVAALARRLATAAVSSLPPAHFRRVRRACRSPAP